MKVVSLVIVVVVSLSSTYVYTGCSEIYADIIMFIRINEMHSLINILRKLRNGWSGVAVTAFVTSTKLSYVEPG